MKKAEIKVGGHYKAKVNNRIVTVRVIAIKDAQSSLSGTGPDRTFYHVTNLSTGRKTWFRSAAKFKSEAVQPVKQEAIAELVESDVLAETLVDDDEQSDPNPAVNAAITANDKELAEQLMRSDFIGQVIKDGLSEGENSSDPTTIVQLVELTQTTHVGVPAIGLANKIASIRQTREVGSPVAGMIPNAEQEAILAAAIEPGLRVLIVAAGAGTGKTATLKMLEQVLPGKIQYTAFNSALVAESKTKFTKADCNTTHSLAFRAVGYKYKHRLGGDKVKSYEVAQILGIQPLNILLPGMGAPDAEGKLTDKIKTLQPDFLAGKITTAIRRFCQSAEREIQLEHFSHIDGIDAVIDGKRTTDNNKVVREYLLQFAQKAWTDLVSLNGTLPFNHDCYVKIWQLGVGDNRPVIAADHILLDEAQDTAPVFLDILKQQTHATLILVGDDNQQIYEWRGAVNAMSSFKGAPRRMLSQSYRFGQAVADVANAVLKTLEESTDLVMRGLQSIPSRVEPVESPRCYLYRTNAGAVSRVMVAVSENKRPHLIGGGDEMVRWCDAAMDLQAGRKTRHPELCCFDSWKEVVEYSETEDGSELTLMVKLIKKFGALNIRNALRNMPEEKDADLVVSTAHRSKGREWDTVQLGGDFPTVNKMDDPDRRLLYVAGTRAKLVLDITICPPFCGGRSKDEGGDFIPGIEVRYTAISPTINPAASDQSVGTIPAPTSDSPSIAAVAKGNGIPVDQFTWAKGYNGGWNLRGPKNAKPGDKVKVIKKNGQTSYETIKQVVKQYEDAWIYSV